MDNSTTDRMNSDNAAVYDAAPVDSVNVSAVLPNSADAENGGVAANATTTPSSSPTPSPTEEKKKQTTTERMLAELLQLNESNFMTTLNNNSTTAAASAGAADVTISASKALAASNADAILLSMLDSEVHRLKAIDRTQKEGLERKERDGKRLAVLLSMSHDQLEQLKARNEKLIGECDDRQKEIVSLRDKSADFEKKFKLATEDKEAYKIMSDNNNSAGKALTAKLELENKLQKETIDRLRNDSSSSQIKHTEEKDLIEVERRKAFEMRVALETRLRSVEEELKFIQEMRQKETRTATTREYDLSVMITNLKKEVNELRGSQESTSRNSFEVMSSVRSENITLQDKCRSLELQLAEATRAAFEKQTTLQSLLNAKTAQLESQDSSAKAREKVSETQIQKFITDLRVAQEEVNDLAGREASKNEEQVQKIIKLNSELNATSQMLTDARQEIENLKGRLRQQEVDTAIAKENATNGMNQKQREHQELLSKTLNELHTATVELTWKSEKLMATEVRVQKLLDESESAKDTHLLESAALKREIEGYRQVVTKLNYHIEENLENKLLAEQNSNLQSQISIMGDQLRTMNGALSSARVEVDIADNHRQMLLMEQLDSQLVRLNALEKERLEARPLIERLAAYFATVTSGAGAHQQQLLLENGAGVIAGRSRGGSASNATNAAAAAKNVSFQSPSSKSSNALTAGSSVSSALVGGGEGPDELLRIEEASIHRTLDAFYRRFGGSSSGSSTGASGSPTKSSGSGANAVPTTRIKRVN